MSAPTTKALVDRGLEIVAEIAKLQKELKTIEEKLKGVAADRSPEHVPLKDGDREGRQFLARGTNLIVPVVFTADKLVGSFQHGSKEHQRIAASMPDSIFTIAWDVFFKPWNGYESRFDDGQKFRTTASQVLGEDAPAFINACLARDKDGLPKSDVKIEWKHAAAEAKLDELARKTASGPLVPGAAASEVAR